MLKPAQDGKFYLKHQNGSIAAGFEYNTYEANVKLDESGVACCENENIARSVMMRDIFTPFDPFEKVQESVIENVIEIPRRKKKRRGRPKGIKNRKKA